jgi:asparagine synthase (glutamine-hydrolysing)
MASLSPTDLEACFGGPIDLEDLYSEAIVQWDACRTDSLVDRTMQFYTKLYMQDDILTKVDRASMMHSLEVRAPFLDIELVDFVRRIPWRYKLRGGQTKYLLKKALEPLLPNDILYRSKKGFGVPIGSWLQSGAVTLPAIRSSEIDSGFVGARLSAHRRGASDERAFLWNVLTAASFTDRITP